VEKQIREGMRKEGLRGDRADFKHENCVASMREKASGSATNISSATPSATDFSLFFSEMSG